MPFSGHANMVGSPIYYYDDDFTRADLEQWLDIMNTAGTFVGAMTQTR